MCAGCGNSGDKDSSEPDLYSWSDIVGFYATKPEKVELGDFDWATYYQAYGLRIDEYVLTDCGAIDNSEYIDGYVDDYCVDLVGDWYSDMLSWQIYGLNINGSSVDVCDPQTGIPNGDNIEVHDNYVVYKGRTYYTASYFNENVEKWTKNEESSSTPSQIENITVSIYSRMVSSTRFKREYEITVSATGDNFTVQQIGIDRVSGTFYPPTPINTSAHQYTFSVSYTSGSPSKIRGVVKTGTGNHYSSNTITLN